MIGTYDPSDTSQDVVAQRAGLARGRVLRFGGLVVLVAVLAVLCLLSVAVGARSLDLAVVWQVVWNDDGSPAAAIVHDLRLPRTVLGVLVGASLGMAGALMQALTRNPLADPGLLGVGIGASAAVVVAIAFLGITAVSGYVWFAFAGAALVSLAVYVLGATGRAVTPDRMVLAGAAISAVLASFVSAVLIVDLDTFGSYRFWVVGSIAGRAADVAVELLPFFALGILMALALARPLNALALGDEAGRALGANVERTRLVTALAVMLLCGAATAAAGPIGFLGLTVPHVARLICGPDQRWVLPYSMVLAPVLFLASDVLGRVVIAPSEVQVGIVTAVLGAPVFILLTRRSRLAQL